MYLNEAIFYEATVNFTREPAKFTKEKTYDVAFFVDVVGLSETEAVTTLNNLGYKNITVKYEESFETEGTVIAQSPEYADNKNLNKTSIITLTVSKKGTAITTQPNQPNQHSNEERVGC